MSDSAILARQQNRLLSQVTFVTSLGDYVSMFAILVLIHKVSGSVALAAYSVPIKSLGVAFGGLTLPWIVSRYSIRRIIVWSQVVSGILMGFLALYSKTGANSWFILFILLCHSTLRQYFDGARETFSKSLAKQAEQRTVQAQILHGLYSAQFLGPVLSFFLVTYLPIELPLWLDAVSFVVAAIGATKLLDIGSRETSSILRPLTYLRKHPGLTQIFLIRSVGYWIPVGLFNYIIFAVLQDHYHAGLVNAAWIYALIGLGSMSASHTLRTPNSFLGSTLGRLKDAEIAFLSLIVLAFTRIAFINLPALSFAAIVVAISGICNGLNAISTQSLRRKLTTDRQFPEIVGLELVVGRLADWAVSSLCFAVLASKAMNYSQGVWISAISLFILAWFHLAKPLRI